MGIFDFFKRKSKPTPQKESERSLEQISYEIAYFVIPHFVHNDFKKILELCTQNIEIAGPYFYAMACIGNKQEPDREAAMRFKWHRSSLDNRQLLILEYPLPPVVDLGQGSLETLIRRTVGIVLAPYFSAILYSGDGAPEYFVLGQSPMGGGTTVRSVTREGMNCNLGPGPEPSIENFVAAIRERL